jgi:uncharacterized membrane protein (UPF0182 family)
VPNAPDAPQNGVKQPPFYLNVKLPEQQETRFQITAGVTPANRENMAALISASYVDGRPRIEVLELPDDTVVPGPVQVHQRMVNNYNISQQLALLTRGGQASVLYGNLISLPLGNDILYVEPVYVKSSQAGAAPLLQRILMSYGDGGTYVVLEDNLTEGLKALAELGKTAGTPTGPGNTEDPGSTPTTPTLPPGTISPELAQAAADVDKAIEDLRAAQIAGDFVKQGEALKALDDAMSRFQSAQRAASGTAPAATPTPSGAASPAPTTGG